MEEFGAHVTHAHTHTVGHTHTRTYIYIYMCVCVHLFIYLYYIVIYFTVYLFIGMYVCVCADYTWILLTYKNIVDIHDYSYICLVVLCVCVCMCIIPLSLSLSVVCLWNRCPVNWYDIGMLYWTLLCPKGLGGKLLDPKKGIARNPYTMLLQWRARPIHVPVQTGSQFTSYCRSWLRLVGRFLLSFHRDEAILIGPAEQFEVAIAATFVRMMQEGQFTISFPGWPLGSMTIHDIWGLGDLCSQFFIWVSCPFSWGGNTNVPIWGNAQKEWKGAKRIESDHIREHQVKSVEHKQTHIHF